MFLSRTTPIEKKTGYGELGLNGTLGFEDKFIAIKGQKFLNSLSVHSNSELIYDLDAKYSWMTIGCAINDTGSDYVSIDFQIWSGKELLGIANGIKQENGIIYLDVNLDGVRQLKLITHSNTHQHAHSVWIEPLLFKTKPMYTSGPVGKIRIPINVMPKAKFKTAIAMCVAEDKVEMALKTLSSFYAFNDGSKTPLILYYFNLSEDVMRKFSTFKPFWVKCEMVVKSNPGTEQTVLYKTHYVVNADYYISLTPGVIFFDNVMPLVDIFNVTPVYNVVAPLYKPNFITTIESSMVEPGLNLYVSSRGDVEKLRINENERHYSTVVNSAFFLASKKAMMAMDSTIKTFYPYLAEWEQSKYGETWNRHGALLNLYGCRSKNITTLDREYGELPHNVQNLQIFNVHDKIVATSEYGDIKVLLFTADDGINLLQQYNTILNFTPNVEFLYKELK